MPFDPAKPADHAPLSSAEMRAQLTGLKALLDAQAPVYGRLAADWTNSTTSFTDVPGLGFAVAAADNWTAEFVLHTISGPSGRTPLPLRPVHMENSFSGRSVGWNQPG